MTTINKRNYNRLTVVEKKFDEKKKETKVGTKKKIKKIIPMGATRA